MRIRHAHKLLQVRLGGTQLRVEQLPHKTFFNVVDAGIDVLRNPGATNALRRHFVTRTRRLNDHNTCVYDPLVRLEASRTVFLQFQLGSVLHLTSPSLPILLNLYINRAREQIGVHYSEAICPVWILSIIQAFQYIGH